MMARILVIDDDPTYRLLVQRALEQMGHAVESVANGARALRRLVVESFDLIVTDIFMDDMDGFEFMRAKGGASAAQVLVMSGGGSGSLADGTPNFLRIARHLGADAALAKPFAPAALKEAVSSLLAAARAAPPSASAARPSAGAARHGDADRRAESRDG